MSEERNELLEKANALGLDFPSNIKTERLKLMITESEGPALREGTKPGVDDEEVEISVKTETEKKPNTLRQKIAAAKKRASALSVVTITNRDNRENDVVTTVPLSFENQYFGLSRNVPLDIPVELEQALIDIAEGTMMSLHKAEVVNGRRTGNKVTVSVKKFGISYAKNQPSV